MTEEIQLLACGHAAACTVRGCRARATTLAQYIDDGGAPLRYSQGASGRLTPCGNRHRAPARHALKLLSAKHIFWSEYGYPRSRKAWRQSARQASDFGTANAHRA